jgi:hypothetical protein
MAPDVERPLILIYPHPIHCSSPSVSHGMGGATEDYVCSFDRRAAEGRRFERHSLIERALLSIHAPVKGAT